MLILKHQADRWLSHLKEVEGVNKLKRNKLQQYNHHAKQFHCHMQTTIT